jgi:hypothetical protein
VPLLFQGHDSVHIAPGPGQSSIDVAQPDQVLTRRTSGGAQGKYFESTQDGAGFPHLRRIQTTDTEAPAHVSVENAFPSQAEEGLTDRGATHSKLAGQRGIPNSGAWNQLAMLHALKNFLIHVVA